MLKIRQILKLSWMNANSPLKWAINFKMSKKWRMNSIISTKWTINSKISVKGAINSWFYNKLTVRTLNLNQ